MQSLIKLKWALISLVLLVCREKKRAVDHPTKEEEKSMKKYECKVCTSIVGLVFISHQGVSHDKNLWDYEKT